MADISVPRVNDSALLRIFIDETLFNKDKFELSASAYVSFSFGGNSFKVAVNDSEFDEFVTLLRGRSGYGSKIHSISFVDKGINQHLIYIPVIIEDA